MKAIPGGYWHLLTPQSSLCEASSTDAPHQGCSSFCQATFSPTRAFRGVSLPPLWRFAQGMITGTAPQPQGTRTVIIFFLIWKGVEGMVKYLGGLSHPETLFCRIT